MTCGGVALAAWLATPAPAGTPGAPTFASHRHLGFSVAIF